MTDQTILVIGAGNPLRRDDGVGPYIIDLLHRESLPTNVILMNVGTDGLSMIGAVKGVYHVIIVDAVDMNKLPGEIRMFSPADVKLIVRGDSFSTHGFGLAETLELMDLLGHHPRILRIIGIQPEDINYGTGLSQAVLAKVPELIAAIKNSLSPKRCKVPTPAALD